MVRKTLLPTWSEEYKISRDFPRSLNYDKCYKANAEILNPRCIDIAAIH